ncbi:MAG: hypothetical protein ABIA63_03990 [bacterium]
MAQNARVGSLGAPNVHNKNLIDDLSDVLYFPTEVTAHADYVQGVAGNYVFVSKSFADLFSAGFLFGKSSYLTSETPFSTDIGIIYSNAVAGGILNAGFTQPNNPSNAGHLLLGIKPSSAIGIGLDVYREALNSSGNNTDKTVPNVTSAMDMNSKYGAMGFNGGMSLNLGLIEAKAFTGIAMLGLDKEVINTSDVTGTNVTTKRSLKSSGGYYIPLSVKAGLKAGSHKLTGGIDFSTCNYQFEAAYADGANPIQTIKSNKTSIMNIGLGAGDEIEFFNNTKFYISLAGERDAKTSTPETVDDANPEVTTSTIRLPKFSMGFEYVIKNPWKLDAIALRTGGNKSVIWTSVSSEGGSSSSENSSEPTISAFNWTTGLAVSKGNFDLSMVIGPAEWNGLYIIGGPGSGPSGAIITFTYKFGGSLSGSSNAGSPAVSP